MKGEHLSRGQPPICVHFTHHQRHNTIQQFNTQVGAVLRSRTKGGGVKCNRGTGELMVKLTVSGAAVWWVRGLSCEPCVCNDLQFNRASSKPPGEGHPVWTKCGNFDVSWQSWTDISSWLCANLCSSQRHINSDLAGGIQRGGAGWQTGSRLMGVDSWVFKHVTVEHTLKLGGNSVRREETPGDPHRTMS